MKLKLTNVIPVCLLLSYAYNYAGEETTAAMLERINAAGLKHVITGNRVLLDTFVRLPSREELEKIFEANKKLLETYKDLFFKLAGKEIHPVGFFKNELYKSAYAHNFLQYKDYAKAFAQRDCDTCIDLIFPKDTHLELYRELRQAQYAKV